MIHLTKQTFLYYLTSIFLTHLHESGNLFTTSPAKGGIFVKILPERILFFLFYCLDIMRVMLLAAGLLALVAGL
jgi:hypothetical protein